ncbi:MAG: DoxX family protein [Planctomycetes bacterium]|nr:DoxX family protein [Planctomycetota bacterium]
MLGATLLLSGALKSIDGTAPVLAAGAYHLVPAWLALAVGAVLPALEVVVGAALWTGWQRRAAAIWALGLGLAFAAANGSALARGLAVDCQCFGGLGGGSPAVALGVDAGLIALALLVLSSTRRP